MQRRRRDKGKLLLFANGIHGKMIFNYLSE